MAAAPSPSSQRPVALLALLSCVSVLAVHDRVRAQPVDIPNQDFREGDPTPISWTLSGGEGQWIDREVIEVRGTGSDSNYWRCAESEFEPGGLYHIRVRARRLGGSGTAIMGPTFANRDFRSLTAEWQEYDYVFRAPDRSTGHFLRLGQWHSTGVVQYDAVRIVGTVAVHQRVGELLLGEGESTSDGQYRFLATFGHIGSNFHRPLASATASFNSDRWVFGERSQVTYRMELPGHPLLSARVGFNVNYHTRGECIVEASRDGATWQVIASRGELGDVEAAVPAALFPAARLLLRLRTPESATQLQVNRLSFESRVQGSPPDGIGRTWFADVQELADDFEIVGVSLADRSSSSGTTARLLLLNKGDAQRKISIGGTLTTRDGRSPRRVGEQSATAAAKGIATFDVSVPANRPGRHGLDLQAISEARPVARLALSLTVPDYYRSDYGFRLPMTDDSSGASLWWCDATHKIPPTRTLPVATSDTVRLEAAKNDFEAVQLVIRASKAPLEGLTAEVTDLRRPNGESIPASAVRVLRVAYHRVRHPTDSTGVRDRWPDALPPLRQPLRVAAGENQPLWILVRVPATASAGDYRGTIHVRGRDLTAAVPLRLHVWNFALPERNHIETAFGLSAGNIFRYHQVRSETDRRKVLDMYLRNFSEHRISPYNPVPLDPIRVRFKATANPPAAEVDFTAFDREMKRVVENYHFTGYRLPVQGMGGGTFHSRREPEIAGFGSTTSQYRAMFSDYVGEIERHLRDKGWLDLAYVYWFDEPDPKDYAFVRAGMSRLREHAPGLRRMLTEQPVDDLADVVDIWCPVSPNYEHEAAETRRQHDQKFWWYVCTGPKAPFCTLFIDHPATELRVWLWQTWQRKIDGILVWSSNYWTSSAAFPDTPQNPYEDPMGYVSGYSTPRGTKRFWGNGDGRFVYPPEAAAVPGASGPGPVIQPPVASIRWEMLREGIEDWEYLYHLRDLLSSHRGRIAAADVQRYERLLEVPESITSSMTRFTTDPTPIYERRRAVARAIEELSR